MGGVDDVDAVEAVEGDAISPAEIDSSGAPRILRDRRSSLTSPVLDKTRLTYFLFTLGISSTFDVFLQFCLPLKYFFLNLDKVVVFGSFRRIYFRFVRGVSNVVEGEDGSVRGVQP